MKTDYLHAFCATAVATLFAQGVFAANPVGIWKTPGTNLTSGDYTWTNNGGAADGGALVIGTTETAAGLAIDLATGNTIRDGKAVTLVIDAEVPAYEAQTILLNVLLDGANNVSVGLNTDGSMKQLWGKGGDYGESTYTADGRAVYAIRYSTAGTTTFVNGVQKMTSTGLMSSTAAITKLAIGSYHGVVEDNAAAAEGVKIHRIALFAEALSNDDVAAIDWDAEVATAGTYTATVTEEGVSWDVTPPANLLSGSVLNFSGTGAIGNLTVPTGVTANLDGDLSVTLTNNGTVNINSGTCEVTRGAAQSIKGTVNIKKGATFKSLSDDSVAYNGGTTLNVYGTLDLGTIRWTVGGSSVINCYGGCTVTAAETNTRAIDLYRGGEIITVNSVDGEPTIVSLPALSPRNNNSTIKIASGMTVTLQKPIAKSDTNNGLINITGGGKLDGTIEMKGVAINLGSTNGQTAKFVAVEGTNTLKWTGDGSAHICNNDSAESPFITVNSGATLKIAGKDFSGWNGALTANGWIRNNGSLVFTGDTAGSRFWREHIVFGNGATMTVDNSNRRLLLYGGAGAEDAAQFNLPAGTAAINAGSEDANAAIHFGNDGDGGWAGVRADQESPNKATGFSVGVDATLTVNAPIHGDQAIVKYGKGTLVLSNAANTYSGTVTLNAGTIKSATTLTVQVPEGHTLHTDTESEEGVTIYSVTRNPVSLYLQVADGTQHIDLGRGERLTLDAEGEQEATYGEGDTITVLKSVQLFVYTAYANAKFIVGDADHAEVNLGFARTGDGEATMDGFDVTLVNGGIVEVNNVTRGGSWKHSMNPELKNVNIHGDGKVVIGANQNTTIMGASTITVPVEKASGATLKLAAGATLTVAEELAEGVLESADKTRLAFDAETLTYSTVNQWTIKIVAIANTKVQYRQSTTAEWTDAPAAVDGFYSVVVDQSTPFYFQYIADPGWVITGDQSGLKFTNGVTADYTYNPVPKPITVSDATPVWPESWNNGHVPTHMFASNAFQNWVSAGNKTDTDNAMAEFLLGVNNGESTVFTAKIELVNGKPVVTSTLDGEKVYGVIKVAYAETLEALEKSPTVVPVTTELPAEAAAQFYKVVVDFE